MNRNPTARNPNRERVRQNMAQVDRSEMFEKLRTVLDSVPPIRPYTFKFKPKIHGIEVDCASEYVKTVICFRSPIENQYIRHSLLEDMDVLRSEGYLVIFIFPQALLVDRYKLGQRLQSEIFAHIKGKRLT